MQLKPGTLLQGGKYRILRTLGQGGFGITYEAEQILLHRKVAVKEFFMKDCCERDENTSWVTIGTGNQRTLVEKFRGKFIREAQMIAGMEHSHIIRVTDVFEENNTAYYVMDYLPGGSLSDKVKKDGPLSEAKAEKYIRQVADALDYIHSQNTVHLDVKPSNILLNAKGEAILIDFGISKHYDDTGEQTSSTPVGISKGYAPLEQGRDGDVSQFGPSTDIYALGATLYYFVTGIVPPEASIVNEDGLSKPQGVSDRIWATIIGAMQPRRKDRPQSSNAFLSLFDGSIVQEGHEDEESTMVKTPIVPPSLNKELSKQNSDSLSSRLNLRWLWAIIAGVSAVIIAVILLLTRSETKFAAPSTDTNLAEQQIAENQTLTNQQPVLTPEQESRQLSESSGSIKVESVPSGATIWLDGKSLKKTTPNTLSDILPGKHTVKLVLDGYSEYQGIVSVYSGKPASLNPTLKKKDEAPVIHTSKSINGHEYVDLGLSVKWATTNIGASSPSEYGSYFAWGETKTKGDYSWDTYQFRVSGDSAETMIFSKYNMESIHGMVDNKSRLDLSDDAARVNWGGTWRMPTEAELKELRAKCTWTWTTQDGKDGYKITSKSNGNSIFLPAAGTMYSTSLKLQVMGGYATSSLGRNHSYQACALSFFSDSIHITGFQVARFVGLTVRPVSE